MKFRCETCDLSFQSAFMMREHFKSQAHREKADFSIVDAVLNRYAKLVEEELKDGPDKV